MSEYKFLLEGGCFCDGLYSLNNLHETIFSMKQLHNSLSMISSALRDAIAVTYLIDVLKYYPTVYPHENYYD